VRIVVRAQQRLALIRAALLADGTLFEEAPIKRVAALEPPACHAARRTDDVGGFIRKRHVERAVLRSEETGRRERFELLAFAQIEPLPDVDEGGHRGIPRPERPRHDGADVRGRHGLRRRVAGVPLILMSRVENEAKVTGRVGPDECPAVDHARQPLETLREPDAVNGRVD
jgi:hypothetical protein